MVNRRVELLRREQPQIRTIELDISMGRQLVRNLTSVRDVLLLELRKPKDDVDMKKIQLHLDRINSLITLVQTRTDDAELRFRTYLHKISTGEIRTEQDSRTLLQAISAGYHKSLRDLSRRATSFLNNISKGNVFDALVDAGLGVIDFNRLKFKPLELALDAITRRGSFDKPIRGIIAPQ